jgi:predicted transcriptional regulator
MRLTPEGKVKLAALLLAPSGRYPNVGSAERELRTLMPDADPGPRSSPTLSAPLARPAARVPGKAFTVRLDVDVNDRLEENARVNGVSMAALVQAALEEVSTDRNQGRLVQRARLIDELRRSRAR